MTRLLAGQRRSESAIANVGLLKSYRLHGYAVLPQFVSEGVAAQLLLSTNRIPRQRVSCGINDVTWSEQVIPLTHSARTFFERPATVQLVRDLTGVVVLSGVHCWTSTYALSEFINPHRDSAGLLQLLVCLRSPRARGYGGELVLDGSALYLMSGDAVVFDATTVEHHTTPLEEAPGDPSPSRVVLVGRYFGDR